MNTTQAVPVALPQPRILPIHREVARALLATFRPRMDVYAERLDREQDVARLNAWAKEHGARSGWAVGDWKPVRRQRQFVPLTLDVVTTHVAGLRTIGFYPLHDNDTCNSVSVDFDNHRGARVVEADPMEDVARCIHACARADLRAIANVSRGGRGSWLHVLPPPSTPAWVARAILTRVLREAGVKHVDEGGTFDALFPKQDHVRRIAAAPGAHGSPEAPQRADIGNLFCVPICGRWLTADTPGTHLIGTDPRDMRAQISALTEY